jgi:hypothetical protein
MLSLEITEAHHRYYTLGSPDHLPSTAVAATGQAWPRHGGANVCRAVALNLYRFDAYWDDTPY